eukprot:m.19875 g.19875  ORF g.19875 m.19875 type:complete len:161 (-) comp6703_c0_seq2:45-527(-)
MGLEVAVDIKQSAIPGAGKGVFAKEDIKKGQMIWKNDDKGVTRVSQQEFVNLMEGDKLTNEQKTHWGWHVFYDKVNNQMVLCTDGDEYTNHSETPNVVADDNDEHCLAARDIKAGEELCEDYRIFYINDVEAATAAAWRKVCPERFDFEKAVNNGEFANK